VTRLRAFMRPGRKGAPALAFVLLLALMGFAGCGSTTGKTAEAEGVPIELGDLKFNVQETRFLNPAQPDDSAYLAGQKVPPPPSKAYLGVFLQIHNSGGDPATLPANSEMSIVDTTGAAYESIPSHTPFAAPLGSVLGPHDDVPAPNTPAAGGPTGGALVLWLVDQSITENRPLKLEILYQGETGEITLDI
jgi:hypothetical protein